MSATEILSLLVNACVGEQTNASSISNSEVNVVWQFVSDTKIKAKSISFCSLSHHPKNKREYTTLFFTINGIRSVCRKERNGWINHCEVITGPYSAKEIIREKVRAGNYPT